jgi:hypothetical protein
MMVHASVHMEYVSMRGWAIGHLLRLSQTMLVIYVGGIANPRKILRVPVCVVFLVVPSLEKLVISL